MQNLEFFMMSLVDPIDRFVSEGNLAVDDNTINVPWVRKQRELQLFVAWF